MSLLLPPSPEDAETVFTAGEIDRVRSLRAKAGFTGDAAHSANPAFAAMAVNAENAPWW